MAMVRQSSIRSPLLEVGTHSRYGIPRVDLGDAGSIQLAVRSERRVEVKSGCLNPVDYDQRR